MSMISMIAFLNESVGIGVLVFPILFWLFVCASGMAPLILLRFSNFSPVGNAAAIFEKAYSVVDPFWAKENGFIERCAIQPLGIPMAIFTNSDHTIAMVVYFAGGQQIIDFVSEFPGDISVTTSTSIDGPVVPVPRGVMFQTFKGRDAQQLLKTHVDGLEFLKGHLRTNVIPHTDVASSMKEFIGQQLRHLCFRPWKILSLPYRWAITRFARMNLTLEDQERKGIIDIDRLVGQSRSVPSKAELVR